MLSTSLLHLSTLFGGGRGGMEERFKLHAHYCLKNAKISALCEKYRVQNGLGIPMHFFSDCSKHTCPDYFKFKIWSRMSRKVDKPYLVLILKSCKCMVSFTEHPFCLAVPLLASPLAMMRTLNSGTCSYSFNIFCYILIYLNPCLIGGGCNSPLVPPPPGHPISSLVVCSFKVVTDIWSIDHTSWPLLNRLLHDK